MAFISLVIICTAGVARIPAQTAAETERQLQQLKEQTKRLKETQDAALRTQRDMIINQMRSTTITRTEYENLKDQLDGLQRNNFLGSVEKLAPNFRGVSSAETPKTGTLHVHWVSLDSFNDNNSQLLFDVTNNSDVPIQSGSILVSFVDATGIILGQNLLNFASVPPGQTVRLNLVAEADMAAIKRCTYKISAVYGVDGKAYSNSFALTFGMR